jgi:sensor histidine kinase YesM
MGNMSVVRLVFVVGLLVIVSTTTAQNPIESVSGSIREQLNTAGQQIQEKAVQHALEGNLTDEHIFADLNATKDNLTEIARAKINQEIDESKNLTSEQIETKAEEELKRRMSQQQPGFEGFLALLAALASVGLMGRRE